MSGEYCLEEITSPSGYIKNSVPVCFTVDNVNKKVYNFGSTEPLTADNDAFVTISISNEQNEITINKVDEKGNALAGAKLALYKVKTPSNDEEDTTSVQIGDDWISDGHGKTFSQLAPGWYLITEEPPAGYVASSPKYFRVRDDGRIVDGSTVITSITIKN